jgi:maltose O-acetyltransferase
MLSVIESYSYFLQSIVSLESALSTPGSSSWFRLLCLRAMGIKVKGPIWVARGTWFYKPHNLALGQRVGIGEDSKIVCHSPIIIGDDFLASCELHINSGTHDITSLKPLSAPPITIGNRVWCGVRVTICSGVSIGDDVIIGAGSVVTKSIPSGYVAYGVPAKPVRKIERDETTQLWSPFNEPSLLQRAHKKLTHKLKSEN